MTKGEVVTLGETMGLFATEGTGPLACGRRMTFGIAGAESNVAIGVRRLGHTTRWIGRIGADAIGTSVFRELRAEGVDLDGVVVDDTAPTGVMIKVHRSAAVSSVTYMRNASAGSRLSPEDVRPELFAGAHVVHITGITPALSASAREAVERALEMAESVGAIVSVDVNYRRALWPEHDAAEPLRNLVARADVAFASELEAEILVGAAAPERTLALLAELTGRDAVLKLGERGCVAVIDGVVHREPAFAVPVVDPVGAGDAFVAGYLAALLDGEPAQQRLRTAALCGALVVSVSGDWEGLATRADIDAFGHRSDPVDR
jgi:2-dehydro-3-deoxygluconokinase